MKTIVTSALPYSYSMPHLGNFTGSVLPADVYFKYLQMRGEDAIFICGSDQHGTPIELRAIKEKVEPEELANSMHDQIREAFERFGCTFTHYGKTHSEANRKTVYEIFEALHKDRFIIEQESTQPYCSNDRRFLTDRLIEGTCPYCKSNEARGDQCNSCGKLLTPEQIIDPHCTICGKSDITFKVVKNLAISLDRLQGEIKRFITSASKNEWTKNAVNKSLSYVDEGLKPRDITRHMKWGFPVPMAGFEDAVFYVWFDAIIGYIGMTREWDEKRWEGYWKGKDTSIVHFMGKDNIEFHTLMWPGVLIGSKLGYALPTTIRASEYLTSRQVKFSKSKGVGLTIDRAIEIADSDYWRFALMHMYPETADSEFTIDLFVEIVNKIMNGKVGNLLNRVLTIASANRQLIGKANPGKYEADAEKIVKRYMDHFNKFELREALHALVELADYGNELMSKTEPWKLAKMAAQSPGSKEEFSTIMNALVEIIYKMGIMLHPFSPTASAVAMSFFGIKGQPEFAMFGHPHEVDYSVEIKPIFEKITEKQVAMLEKYT
ncbi:MAG: methionine--tRNA ligase [Candidatus Micrarchaeota archaeon]|nr:methionine--tRNA ligase [Candidatus Micrarchaeota archaeon]